MSTFTIDPDNNITALIDQTLRRPTPGRFLLLAQ
jgi:hypothetical protein